MTTEGASFIFWYFPTLHVKDSVEFTTSVMRFSFLLYTFNVSGHKRYMLRVLFDCDITNKKCVNNLKVLGVICSLNPFPSTDLNEELLGNALTYLEATSFFDYYFFLNLTSFYTSDDQTPGVPVFQILWQKIYFTEILHLSQSHFNLIFSVQLIEI